MVNDDLEQRAAEPIEGRADWPGRFWQVLGVGFTWSLAGALFGLLVAVIAVAWPGTAAPIGVLGGLVGAMIGALFEAGRSAD